MASNNAFTRLAKTASRFTGRPLCFGLALLVVLVWIVTGPIFGFSDTWQLVINTGTTIVTFLMVFLIQATQNRDTEAMHLKLDELIRATRGAHNRVARAVRKHSQAFARQGQRRTAAARLVGVGDVHDHEPLHAAG